ncbi:MAG: 16S rRNA (uracil(1498)-N(3))-methyltransferase [Lachnospiraceae bacterium]|nr:16S rRNA (uracil(1498)-N(3))-methyltransferase [Lachnospiraceae bacterium]
MYRFFSLEETFTKETVEITGEDVNHIKNVLRMKIGEEIQISNGNEKEYICTIESMEKDKIIAKIVDVIGMSSELPVKITLFQGLPKGDKVEYIIQKAVELGAHRIVLVDTKRTVVKLDEKKASKKIERYNSIALSAAKQAKRSQVPKVEGVMSLEQALKEADELDEILIPYENAQGISYARQVVKNLKGKESIGVFIGPEGGFAEEEVEKTKNHGAKCITLGKRILRTETAALTALSILMFELEEEEA